jgi:hypothetical protein
MTGMPKGQRSTDLKTKVAERLALLPMRATTAALRFVDENGPKGGRAMRCSLTLKTPGRPPIYAAAVSMTRRLAADAVLAKLERRLARVWEAERDNRRHPRKYFTASREWAAG